MKVKLGIFSIILLLMMVPVCFADSTSSGSTTSSSTSSSSSSSSTTNVDDAALVYVSNVTMDPVSYFPGDTGTVTVVLTNSGTSAIGLSHPDIMSTKLNINNEDNWEAMSYVGADSTITYTLITSAIATDSDGTYYGLFSIGSKSGNSIHYPIKIIIDSDPLSAAITDKPTSFSPEAEQNVTLTIMNTRAGDVSNVVITPEGSGSDAYPSTKLVSTIKAGSSTDVTFGITPHTASNLTFHVSYENGNNPHSVDVVLPINFGADKTAAVPVVNNVVLSSSGSTYDITGDITNAGVSDAKGVVVSVGSPAKGTGTYPEYAIGSIASDDSNSFEVTFTTTDLSSVPLIVSWKDSEGNDYSSTKTLDLSTSSAGDTTGTSGSSTKTSSSSSMSGGPGGMSGGPGGDMGGPGGSSSSSSTTSLLTGSKGGGISSFTWLIYIVIILIIGIVLWKKKKWIMAKLKKQQ
jgi:hypothetical protein